MEAEKPELKSTVPATVTMVLIVIAVGFWLYSQRRSPEWGVAAPGSTLVETLPGFRPDAGYLPDDSLLGFIEIPAGEFVMGSDPASDPSGFENELWAPGGGSRPVDLSAFYIARSETTLAQYLAFATATGRSLADSASFRRPLDFPVADVSWPDALAYANWLDAELSASPATPPSIRSLLADGWSISLPTEAQWEKAARGTDGRIFPWGNTPEPGKAVFGMAAPEPVGSRPCPECAHGLADMAGNVWELTRTPYGPLSLDREAGIDLSADALWVMRGGGYSDGAQLVRSAVRGGADPGARRPFIGFRIVLTPP